MNVRRKGGGVLFPEGGVVLDVPQVVLSDVERVHFSGLGLALLLLELFVGLGGEVGAGAGHDLTFILIMRKLDGLGLLHKVHELDMPVALPLVISLHALRDHLLVLIGGALLLSGLLPVVDVLLGRVVVVDPEGARALLLVDRVEHLRHRDLLEDGCVEARVSVAFWAQADAGLGAAGHGFASLLGLKVKVHRIF